MLYDAVVIGGGPAGLTCARVLAATRGNAKHPQDLRFALVNSGHSDLEAAELHTAPGVAAGTSGVELLAKMHIQALAFGNLTYMHAMVSALSGESGNFVIALDGGVHLRAKVVVLATGYKRWTLDVPGVQPVQHPWSLKQRIALVTDARGGVAPGIYCCGGLAGAPSMFAVAAGSGAAVACSVLAQIEGKPAVVHDTPGSRR